MYHLAYQITGDPEDAEDAVQQAFLYILEHPKKIGAVVSNSTRTFVSIIAEHKAIDLVRKRRPNVSLDSIENQAVPPPSAGEGELLRALRKLPKRYQDILLLRYDIGYTTGELAEMLHISRFAAHKLLLRAKNALRKTLDEEAPEK